VSKLGSAGTSIGLLGDVMLGRGVGEALRSQPPETLWSPGLGQMLSSLDIVVCNLECCISLRGQPTTLVPEKPFFFRAPPAAVDALRAINVRAVGVANNHALDFGEEALTDTLELLHAVPIATAGAGLGVGAARQPAIVDVGDMRLALITVTDHPVQYAAAAGRWGVAYAPLSEEPPAWLLDQISTARRHCDVVVAFLHWGPNMTTQPAAWQQRVARSLHAAGADLVAGHSAHVFHGVGWHGGGPVVFDLGGALDDYRVDPDLRNDLGLLAVWHPDADPELELVGLRLEHCRTRLADGLDADWIALRLDVACRALGTAVRRVAEQRFAVEPLFD
jgi:poly-gamma-glutamate synthesis protein (capsule biosynthesis protein)